MYKMTKIILTFLLLSTAVSANTVLAKASLVIGSIAAKPDDTVNVPVHLSHDGSAVALQFDLLFDPSQLTSMPALAGGNSGSNHTIQSSQIRPGVRRVLIADTSKNNVLGSGIVTQLSFKVHNNANVNNKLLGLSGVVISNNQAMKVMPDRLLSGAITIGDTPDSNLEPELNEGINLSESEQATQAIAPQISPAGGSYTILDKPLVTLGSAIQSANIYYTLDGSTPTTASSLYNTPLAISESVTLKAFTVAPGYRDSLVTSVSFSITESETQSGDWNSDAIQPSSNPFFWKYKGNQVFLVGASDDDALFKWDHSDMVAHLNLLQATGGNFIRNVLNYAENNVDGRDSGANNIQPHGSSNGVFDLNTFNPSYFNRLETFLYEAQKRNIIVQVTLWEGFDFINKEASYSLKYHDLSWNPANNINYTSAASGMAEVNESYFPFQPGFPNKIKFFNSIPSVDNNTMLLGYQKLFVEKVLESTLKFNNVTYNVHNERHNPIPKAWADYWVGFVKSYASSQGKTIYIADMGDKYYANHPTQKEILDTDVNGLYEISQIAHLGGQLQYDQTLYARNRLIENNNRKPINAEKIYVSSSASTSPGQYDDEDKLWRFVFGGAAAVRFHRQTDKPHGFGLTYIPPSESVPTAQPQIKSMRMFVSDIDIFSMQPNNAKLSGRALNEAYLLENDSAQYAIYFTGVSDQSIQLNLGGESGDFTVDLLDVRNAQWIRGYTTVQGGGYVTLATPDSSQYVIVLKGAYTEKTSLSGNGSLLAGYTFNEGSGNMIRDVSGNGSTPLNLNIENEALVQWVDGGLFTHPGARIRSVGAASKISNAIMASQAFTVEAWITPATTEQSGPARIVSISRDQSARNLTLGQDNDRYIMRVRRNKSDLNGSSTPVTTESVIAPSALAVQHVVFTQAEGGESRLYVNGTLQSSLNLGEIDFTQWNLDYSLVLANEIDNEEGVRLWSGTFHGIAIYDYVLGTAQVMQNYLGGAESE